MIKTIRNKTGKSLREKAYERASESDNPEWFIEIVFSPEITAERAYKLSRIQITHLVDAATQAFIEEMCYSIKEDNKVVTLINVLKRSEGVDAYGGVIKALGFTLEELDQMKTEDILFEYMKSTGKISMSDLS